MKKYIIILTLISSITSYSQKITRGPDIGEIYFIGPTHSGTGLYYSTDFGETATCMDSINLIVAITADKTLGVVYYLGMPENLFYSNDYGNQGSWQFVNNNLYPEIRSGVSEGFIYNNIESHSSNYGSSFISHNLNGFFGNLESSEIDNQYGTAYATIKSSLIPDSIFFFITYNNFDNLILKNVYHKDDNIFHLIRRGMEYGELFSIQNKPNSFDPYNIYYSNDFGDNFTHIEKFNIQNYYSYGVEGGRQEGEIYILYNFVNQAFLNAHTYIFHSTNYGKTFEVYHPFKKGNEPVLANFSTLENEIQLMNPVEFSNFSIGDIQDYQWDFENDGIIDSYEEFPTHTYQDTGYYSVKLSVVGQDSTNTFIKENYIHVIDTITSISDLKFQHINISPNPFNDKISIEKRADFKMIEIYDLNGKIQYTKTIDFGNETENIDARTLDKGIYILKIITEGQEITKKIIKI